jgi:hypothetical protein
LLVLRLEQGKRKGRVREEKGKSEWEMIGILTLSSLCLSLCLPLFFSWLEQGKRKGRVREERGKSEWEMIWLLTLSSL